ncbi:alpha/beta hydrolase [Mastigocladopsis repens]|uniref:alpha/beta hydrolase n=1 Tax=Mastigocladopsis repens TaxID=221287 RepID=UPI0003708C56|nr:alpha/beta fold hydrolase [Mastigocladopsis repens]
MSDYSITTAAIIQQAKSLEETLPIRNDACRSKFFFHPHPTAKVCLFFHGFTAGPYQFEPIGETLFDAGYNVLVPLQPGHGVAGNWNGDNPPPLPTEREIYQEFALSWLKVAQQLGQQVIVGGLSTGGNLAATLALEHPQQIEKALLFAPYISGNNAIVNFIVEVIPIYYEWLNKDNPGNFGYDGFQIPALRIFLDMGQEMAGRIENNLAVPMFIISSESDQAINQSELQDFSRATIKQQPKSWYYRFDKIFDIPHTMMTDAEGNKYQDLLITLAKAYIESDITWAEVMKIGYQILQGKTFDTAVTELNLTERVSPDLSVMLAVMDKQMIIDAHNNFQA